MQVEPTLNYILAKKILADPDFRLICLNLKNYEADDLQLEGGLDHLLTAKLRLYSETIKEQGRQATVLIMGGFDDLTGSESLTNLFQCLELH